MNGNRLRLFVLRKLTVNPGAVACLIYQAVPQRVTKTLKNAGVENRGSLSLGGVFISQWHGWD